MFITLTEMPRQRKVILNKNYIVYVCKSQSDKGDTYVRYNAPTIDDGKGSYFFVKESVDEIEKMLLAGKHYTPFGD